MPTGGVSSAGSGLRLQLTTPGATDVGNAHISGKFIAEGELSGCGGWVTGGSRQEVAFLGEFLTFPAGVIVTTSLAPVGVGWRLTVGNAVRGTTSALETVSIGTRVNNGARGNTVIGAGATCDTAGTNTSGGFNVLIGRSSALSSTTGNPGGTGLGVQIGANTTGTDTGSAVVIGGGIAYSQKCNGPGVKTAVLIGTGILSPGGSNQIVISSSYDGTEASGVTESRNNVIKIGDSTHTVVEIGGRSYSGVITAVEATVNDVNFVATANDAGALYSAITAARTVTLPAANSVRPGFRFRVADFSGNASAVNTITTNPAGADTLVGPGSAVINGAYGSKRFMSDGTSKWMPENNW